jgi:hypothetical protein
MADQANVYVRNNSTHAIGAVRYCLPGGDFDLDISIASENEEMIYLVRSQTYLVIKLPNGKYTADHTLVVSNEELLSWSTLDDQWTVEIKHNELGSNVPTDVNVYVGEEGP